jgi:hypothetical protein
MTDFTVEATVAAVTDGDWARLRSVIDLVPGTLLIEDPEEPMLVFPVEADSPMKAVLFVDGIAKLVGLEVVSGSVGPTPDADFDMDEDDEPREEGTPAVLAVRDWVESVPRFEGRVTHEGTVEYA